MLYGLNVFVNVERHGICDIIPNDLISDPWSLLSVRYSTVNFNCTTALVPSIIINKIRLKGFRLFLIQFFLKALAAHVGLDDFIRDLKQVTNHCRE